jgi:hypothetical protein
MKGGDKIGFTGHKKVKGDRVAAFCDRNCNVIAPFVTAPGNRNESPLLRDALPMAMHVAHSVGVELQSDCRFERLGQLHHAFKTLAYTMINLRHFCRS